MDPLLLPEVIHNILIYLLPPEYQNETPSLSHPLSVPFDVWSCSLLSKTWHVESHRLLNNTFPSMLRDDDFIVGLHDHSSMRRLAELLVESKRLGLDDYGIIEWLTSDNRSLEISSERLNISIIPVITMNILRSNLSKLTIYYPDTTIPPFSHNLGIPFLDRVLPRVLPFYATAISLSFSGRHSRPLSWNEDPLPLTTLIPAISNYIRTLSLTNFNLDAATSTLIESCTSVETLELTDVDLVNVFHILQLFPQLQRFHCRLNDDKLFMCNVDLTVRRMLIRLAIIFPQLIDYHLVDSAVVQLAISHPQLKEFVFNTYGPCGFRIFDYTLICLLRLCPKLTRFVVSTSPRTDQTLILGLLKHGQQLEEIAIDFCEQFTGKNVLMPTQDSEAVLWPELRYVRFGCGKGLSRSFVARVVAGCPKLKMIDLPSPLNDDGIFKKFMIQRGFT